MQQFKYNVKVKLLLITKNYYKDKYLTSHYLLQEKLRNIEHTHTVPVDNGPIGTSIMYVPTWNCESSTIDPNELDIFSICCGIV